MNYSEGCKVKTRQSVHQYRQLKQANCIRYISWINTGAKGRGHHTQLYGCACFLSLWRYIFEMLKEKRRHQRQLKQMRQSLFGPLLSLSLSLSLISPLAHASIFSDLCVNFFYGCLFSSLFLFFFPLSRKMVYRDKCWMSFGKWRDAQNSIRVRVRNRKRVLFKRRRGLLTSGWRARLSQPQRHRYLRLFRTIHFLFFLLPLFRT